MKQYAFRIRAQKMSLAKDLITIVFLVSNPHFVVMEAK